MSKSNNPDAAKKKGSAGKTFLSVIFYILIQACSLVLALCMELRTKSGSVLGAVDSAAGFSFTKYLTGEICFWCAIAAVIIWFVLWLITTGRIAADITKKFGLDPRKSASILDTFSCLIHGFIPYGAQLLMAAGLAGISSISIIGYLYYPFVMGLFAFGAILLRRPRL